MSCIICGMYLIFTRICFIYRIIAPHAGNHHTYNWLIILLHTCIYYTAFKNLNLVFI